MKCEVTAVGFMSDHPEENFLFNFPMDLNPDYLAYDESDNGLNDVFNEVFSRYSYYFVLTELNIRFCHEEL